MVGTPAYLTRPGRVQKIQFAYKLPSWKLNGLSACVRSQSCNMSRPRLPFLSSFQRPSLESRCILQLCFTSHYTCPTLVFPGDFLLVPQPDRPPSFCSAQLISVWEGGKEGGRVSGSCDTSALPSRASPPFPASSPYLSLFLSITSTTQRSPSAAPTLPSPPFERLAIHRLQTDGQTVLFRYHHRSVPSLAV